MKNNESSTGCDISDEILMNRYANSNIEAFDILFLRWKNRVWNYVSKKIFLHSDREDVVQKVFLKLHTTRHLYKDEYLFAQWIYTISFSVVTDHLRSVKNSGKIKESISLITDQNDYLENEDLLDSQSEKLNDLTEEQKTAINLRYREDMDFSEIANIINKSESNVRKIISRAISKLRKINIVEGA